MREWAVRQLARPDPMAWPRWCKTLNHIERFSHF
jgi:hypothetical protein